MAYLSREALRIVRAEGVEMTRHEAFELTQEIAGAADYVPYRRALASRNRQARSVAVEEFRQRVARKTRLSACDQRIGGPNWRTRS